MHEGPAVHTAGGGLDRGAHVQRLRHIRLGEDVSEGGWCWTPGGVMPAKQAGGSRAWLPEQLFWVIFFLIATERHSQVLNRVEYD